MKAEALLEIEDHFCGAGGTTTGAQRVDGVQVVHAANHSRICIATHSSNYPEIEHSLADIPTLDPRRQAPNAAVLLTSPECREHSYAKGRPKDDPSLFDPTGEQTAERSRSTMDEVPRWAEIKRYRAIVVENVPQILHWCEPRRSRHPRRCRCGVTFRAWLRDMANLGYEHRKCYFNSAFFPPTPQSRDRIYIVFWRRGQRAPNLDYFPPCFCEQCGRVLAGVQTPKPHLRAPDAVRLAWSPHDTVWGRYGEQYYYACIECGARANPAITPAAYAIEWWRKAVKIGERAAHGLAPLRPGTLARIERGRRRLARRPLVVPLDYLTRPETRRPRDVVDPLATITAQQRSALVVQVAGNLGRVQSDGTITREQTSKAWPVAEPLRTVHGTLDRALVVSNMAHNVPRPATAEPTPSVTTGGRLGLVVHVGGQQGQSRTARGTGEPLHAITTENHRALIVANREHSSPREAATEPLPTLTTINSVYLADGLVVPYRAHTRERSAREEELHTITAEGNQHYLLTSGEGEQRLVIANYGSPEGPESKQGWVRDAQESLLGTVTTRDSHAVVTLRGDGQGHGVDEPLPTCATVEQHTLVGLEVPIEECTFRMFEPSELGRGMVMHLNARGEAYVVHGTRREQCQQYGNAVTPPVMTFIVTAIRDSLA
jgi:DNA (cytosine-5)-methyltransferase 1